MTTLHSCGTCSILEFRAEDLIVRNSLPGPINTRPSPSQPTAAGVWTALHKWDSDHHVPLIMRITFCGAQVRSWPSNVRGNHARNHMPHAGPVLRAAYALVSTAVQPGCLVVFLRLMPSGDTVTHVLRLVTQLAFLGVVG